MASHQPSCRYALASDGEVSLNARTINPPVLRSVADVAAYSHRFVATEKLLQLFRRDCARVTEPIAQVVAVLKIGVDKNVFLLSVDGFRLRPANAMNETVPPSQALVLPTPAAVLVHAPTQGPSLRPPTKK